MSPEDTRPRGRVVFVWTMAAAVALLWPAHVIGPLDGMPLDGQAEAIVIGLVLPALWWLCRSSVTTKWSRATIVLLLLWKVTGEVALQQQGLCGAAFAKAPFDGTVQTIRVREPFGALRSWDVRADWREPRPGCTAILSRPLHAIDDFPAWYLNITDQMLGTRDVTMTVRGYLTLEHPGTLTVEFGDDVQVRRVGGSAPSGNAARTLPAGTHAMEWELGLIGTAWRFVPRLDQVAVWDAALVTAAPPRRVDLWLSGWGKVVSPLLVVSLVAAMLLHTWRQLQPSAPLIGWTVAASSVAALIAMLPLALAHRAVGLIGLGAAVIPIRTSLRHVRSVFLMLGVPWLTFFAVLSLPQVGRFSVFSYDDWLAYQIAGYRIVMNGFWLEAGSDTFDYQPLYRWMTGILHLVFGDSSIGELYWDVACLVIGALLAFHLVRSVAGFRAGVVAATATLATFTLSTPWHFIGRGLSEIAAAGWAFLAMFLLLRGRRGHVSWAIAASAMAVLTFYTRLNHLLWMACLPAMLLSLHVPTNPHALMVAVRRIRLQSIAIFAGVFFSSVLLLMLRTWYYTGVFSLFHGTSRRFNSTGLEPSTLLDGSVWSNVMHSLSAFVWMNEPPRPDLRSLIVAVGLLVCAAALCQVPVLRRMPAAVVVTAAGAGVAALFVHAHPYPGRFSIHAVPLASALAVTASVAMWRPQR